MLYPLDFLILALDWFPVFCLKMCLSLSTQIDNNNSNNKTKRESFSCSHSLWQQDPPWLYSVLFPLHRTPPTLVTWLHSLPIIHSLKSCSLTPLPFSLTFSAWLPPVRSSAFKFSLACDLLYHWKLLSTQSPFPLWLWKLALRLPRTLGAFQACLVATPFRLLHSDLPWALPFTLLSLLLTRRISLLTQ